MNKSIEFPSHIASLKPYVPGLPIAAVAARSGIEEDRIVKLASNENPLGASPKALAALAKSRIDLSRYPDSDSAALVDAIAEFHGISREWVVVGAGSESVLGNLVSTMLQPGRSTSFAQYSFQAYVNAVQKVGANAVVVPSPDLCVDLDGILKSIVPSTSLIYVANPGNPTGTALYPDALRHFLKRVPNHIVVLLDEAYFEFLPPDLRGDSIAWVREHANLVVTRTFSKAYGLAGLRVGYGIAQTGLAEMMRRVRSPFTISEAAQVAAVAALEDQAFIHQIVELTNVGRRSLVSGLESLRVRCVESHTNFVLADVGDGSEFARRVERDGFIVRPVASYGLNNWVRITVGSRAEVAMFLEAAKAAR